MFARLFRHLQPQDGRSLRTRRGAHPRRPTFELLEERRLLAVLTVGNLLDGSLADLAGDGSLSLREAIAAINTGTAVDGIAPTSGVFGIDDRIVFAPSLFAGGPKTINLTEGELLLTRSATIAGPGSNLLTIDASGSDATPNLDNGDGSRVFNIDGPESTIAATLSGLSLTGADSSERGGAIRSTESLTVIDCDIHGNASAQQTTHGGGGGIFFDSDSGSLVIRRTTLRENVANFGGGLLAIAPNGSITIDSSTIAANTALSFGGGINFSGDAVISNTLVRDNQAAYGGGIVNANQDANKEVEIELSTISGNTARRAAGIHNSRAGRMSIETSTISGNTATELGGGGIVNFGDLFIESSAIQGNVAAGNGGGIFSQRGRLTLGGRPGVLSGLNNLLVGNDVVFVIDVSGSTFELFEGADVGDVNGDQRSNTILDAEIAAFLALNRRLIDDGLGDTSRISIVTFDSLATIKDMNPAMADSQISTTPLADSDGDGVRDVEQVLRSLRYTGGTNFEDGLAKALVAVNGINGQDTNVIFLSDGDPFPPDAHADEVQALVAAGVHLRAFGVGTGASLPQLQIIDPDAVIFTDPDEFIGAFSGGTGAAGVTISGNSAGGSGGGVYSDSEQVTSINFNTIAFNTADSNADGDGSGGGVAATGDVNISGTILARNLDHSANAPDASLSSSGEVDVRFSLIGDNTGSGLGPAPVGAPDADGNLIGTASSPIDPLLRPLAFNGGPTQTHAILSNSPAVNAGPVSGNSSGFDQRGVGFPRGVGGRHDIGAFEVQPIPQDLPQPFVPTKESQQESPEFEPATGPSPLPPEFIDPPRYLFLDSDPGSGGQYLRSPDSPVEPNQLADMSGMRTAMLLPRDVSREEVMDAAHALGQFDLVSLISLDMGDEPLAPKKQKAEEPPPPPPVEGPIEHEVKREPQTPPADVATQDWQSLALLSALAGTGTLCLSGAWLWREHRRRLLMK